MKKVYALANALVIVLVIFWNYYANTGIINNNTIGDLSAKFGNLFTPAPYAFSIWGFIFLSLIAFAIFQLKQAFTNGEHSDTILQVGPWMLIANLANGTWLWFWLQEQLAVSVLVMLVILVALVMAILRLNMERWDAPRPIIFYVWWPICMYSGWISVALIANVSAWLTQLGWDGGIFSEIQWTIIMISVAGVLNLLMIYTRNMREFAGVGVWALIAIAVRHWGSIPSIQWVAVAWAIVLLATIAYHGFLNRETNPFKTRYYK